MSGPTPDGPLGRRRFLGLGLLAAWPLPLGRFNVLKARGGDHHQRGGAVDASERNKEIVRSFVRAGNARDFGALDALVAEDFQRHCPATPDVDVRSLADFRRFLEQDLETFPDSRVEMKTLVAEGDRVAFWATYGGTQSGPMGPFPASGRAMVCEFSGIFRIEGGKIRELWLTWDNLGILAQLGHWPPAE